MKYKENCIYGAKVSCTETHKIFSDTLKPMSRKLFKRISTHCTKCYEINVRHLNILKHVSYEKWSRYYALFVYRFTQKFSIT